MTRDTLIKHKEIVIICEKNASIIANFNVLLTQLDSKPIVQPIINYIIVKQPLTCSNCGKTGHAKKTYHNKKKEEHVIHFVSIKIIEPVAKIIAKPVKLVKVPLRYPCMICSSSKHHTLAHPQKMKIQNMFRTKPTITSIVVPTTSRLIMYQIMYLPLSPHTTKYQNNKCLENVNQ
jgi:hypothetical protein